MSVKLAAKLPDIDRNGLDQLQGALVRRPEDRHLIVAVVDCGRITTEIVDGEQIPTPTARVQFVEPVRDRDDINTILEVIGRTRAQRVDDATLDFDFGVADPLKAAAADLLRTGRSVVTFADREVGE